jgi:hypothetical protein
MRIQNIKKSWKTGETADSYKVGFAGFFEVGYNPILHLIYL